MQDNIQPSVDNNQEIKDPGKINIKTILKSRIILFFLLFIITIFILSFSVRLLSTDKSVPSSTPTPTADVKATRAPFPTFPDAPRVEGELIIQYAEGQEFINLEKIRQQEITVFLEQNGVISQEKAYDVDDGPLSRSYLLRLREGVSVEEAARKIYGLPEVNNVQPNTEVGLF